jgi:hypothetical protein
MTTPNKIEKLLPNQIFVFGSNLNGNHAGGAALQAKKDFGAEDGVSEGLTGQSYAFPTLDKDMQKVSKEDLLKSKELLYKVAEENKDKEFLVTKVGCGIAGFTEEEMKEIFKGEKPNNIVLPAGWSKVYGYKAFQKGLKCRDFQYEFGKDFYYKDEIELCKSGFHFCKSLGDVYNYYTFGTDIVVCEIESERDVIDQEDKEKSVTNHLRIIRMLNPKEASNNNGINNTGHSNTGHNNTGDRNTGDRNTGHSNTGHNNTGHSNTGHNNTGHSNTGDWNTGDGNTGHSNTGHRNTGHNNTGHSNTGHRNTGDWNTGDWNTGDGNTGYRNTGDRNTGDRNTGHRNTGHRNTGHRNTGYWNTGDGNTGHRNTGDRNTGHNNTGDWNTGHRNTGYFNFLSPENILVFEKEYKYSDWIELNLPSCLYFNTKEWIDYSNMTEEEKEKHPSSKTSGGYLKTLEYKEAFIKSLQNASKEEIEQIKNLPNFDADIFEKISGFRIK